MEEVKMDHAYKNQLQSYALKHSLELPFYATKQQGPAHAPRFKCNVTVCGRTFQSPGFFLKLKAAEHAAAKIALDSLGAHSPEVMDIAYKNLLQEIAQKENSPLPVYATCACGPSHGPTFTSTVEFAGKLFTGEAAKTKKLAEMSAAKVAYIIIKSGNLNQTSLPFSIPSRSSQVDVAVSVEKGLVGEPALGEPVNTEGAETQNGTPNASLATYPQQDQLFRQQYQPFFMPPPHIHLYMAPNGIPQQTYYYHPGPALAAPSPIQQIGNTENPSPQETQIPSATVLNTIRSEPLTENAAPWIGQGLGNLQDKKGMSLKSQRKVDKKGKSLKRKRKVHNLKQDKMGRIRRALSLKKQRARV